MGMDASAHIFYGYKKSISFEKDENGDYLDRPIGFIVVNDSSDDTYLAVEESYEYTDWDYGLHQIFPKKMCDLDTSYFYKVKNYLDLLGIRYSEEDIGWFIICNYS